MNVILIILGVIIYFAIGFFIDRLWAETDYEKERPTIICVVCWPLILPLAFVYYPCFVWPRALAAYIQNWWEIRKGLKKKEGQK